MKIKLILIVSWLLMMFCINVQAQKWLEMMEDPDANYYEVKEVFDEYWKDKEYEGGMGYKPFKRWEAHVTPRMDANGNFNQQKAIEAFAEYKAQQKNADSNFKNGDSGNWRSVGPNYETTDYDAARIGVGKVDCIAFHPTNSNIIFVGAATGGLWKTTDGGATWATNTDQFSSLIIRSVVIDPNNPQRMFLSTGAGIVRSNDGGNTWFDAGNPQLIAGRIHKIIIHPTNGNILLAATNDGVFRTTNGGNNWALQGSATNIWDITFKPNTPNTVYAVGYNDFFYSTNGGVNWTTNNNIGLISGGRHLIAVTPAAPNNVYVLGGYWVEGRRTKLYRSSNSGVNFTLKYDSNNSGSSHLLGGQIPRNLAFNVSPTNSEEIYVAGVNLHKSTNGGTSWTGMSGLHVDFTSLQFANNTTIYATNDGGVYRRDINSTEFHWESLNRGLAITQFYAMGSSQNTPQKIIAGSQDNGSRYFDGASWINIAGADGADGVVTTSGDVYCNPWNAYFKGSIAKKYNTSSFYVFDSDDSGENTATFTPLTAHPQDGNTIYVGHQSVWRTKDAGSTWNSISPEFASYTLYNIVVAPSNTNYIYASSHDDKLHYTTNGESTNPTWTTKLVKLGGVKQYIRGMTVDPDNPQKIWLTVRTDGTLNYKILYSNNAGTSWTDISGSLSNNIFYSSIVAKSGSNDELYVCGDRGVYYRNNTQGDWTMFCDGLPNVFMKELDINEAEGKLRVATFGRGIWESELQNVDCNSINFAYAKDEIQMTQLDTDVELHASGGIAYSWSPTTGLSNPNIANPVVSYDSNVNSRTYTVTVTDANGCTDTETTTVYFNCDDSFASIDLPSCVYLFEDANIQLPATGGISYVWNNAQYLSNIYASSPTVSYSLGTANSSSINTQTYTVNATDAYACIGSAEIDVKSVNDNGATWANFTENRTYDLCPNGNVTLQAHETQSGATYSWSPTTGLSNPSSPNPIVTYNAAMPSTINYQLTITTTNDCIIVGAATVNVHTACTCPSTSTANTNFAIAVPGNFTGNIDVNQSISLQSGGGVSYSWSPSDYLSDPNAQNPTVYYDPSVASRVYTVTVTNAYGCTDTKSTTVYYNGAPRPTIDMLFATNVHSVCNGSTLTFLAPEGWDNYYWGVLGEASDDPPNTGFRSWTYTFSTTGSHWVYCSPSGPSESGAPNANIYTVPAPQAEFTYEVDANTNSIIVTPNSLVHGCGPNTSIDWFVNDGSESFEISVNSVWDQIAHPHTIDVSNNPHGYEICMFIQNDCNFDYQCLTASDNYGGTTVAIPPTSPGTSYDCIPDYTLTNPQWDINNTATTYNASNTIVAKNVLYYNTDVAYNAGEYVRLESGFHARSSVHSFHAYNDGCQVSAKTDGIAEDGTETEDAIEELPKETIEQLIVSEQAYLRNYPNPFNGATTIEYKLNSEAEVSLFVFDITGKQMGELVNSERQEAGIYQYNFEASHLPSGTYYYTLKTKGGIQTQKMHLLK